MEESVKTSLTAICKLFEKYDVKYLIVGGAAVALNGYYRHSVNTAGEIAGKPDFDVWYHSTYENYVGILKVMSALGYDVTEFQNEQSPNPKKSFFKLTFDEFTLDILPEIKANIRFTDAWNRRETVEINNIPIHHLNFFDLVKDKEATGRKKDIQDIQELRRIKKDE